MCLLSTQYGLPPPRRARSDGRGLPGGVRAAADADQLAAALAAGAGERVADLRRLAKPRNPRHSDGIEGGRTRISDTFTHKNSGSCL